MATTPKDEGHCYFSVTRLLGIGFSNSIDLRKRDREPMLWSELERVAELNHKINNPLTAIRNALYLAGKLSSDPEILKYLEIADQEISSISQALEDARCAAGELALRQPRPRSNPSSGPAAA